MSPDDLADRERIRDCLYRYARAIDRCDEALLLGTYWPEARASQLEFSGTRDEFVAWAMPALRAMEASMHLIGNVLIELDGDHAASESYFHGLHVFAGEGGARETMVGGRYVDRHERRGGEWRIIERTVVVDWFRDHADASDWATGPFGMRATRGARAPDDASCRLFGTSGKAEA